MNRAYELKHHSNKGKQGKIRETVRAYRKTAERIAAEQWRLLFTQGRFWRNLDLKHIASALSERFKQSCQYQVVGTLDSFLANRQKDFVEIVRRSRLDETTQHQLLAVNALKAWYKTGPWSLLQNQLEIDPDALTLARRIWRHVMAKHGKPSFRRINMALDSKVALISEKGAGKATKFDYWIRLSTTDQGKPVYIPLSTNTYFDGIAGKRRNFCQINASKNNAVTVCFIKDVPRDDSYIAQTPKISLDRGLSTLVATDQGDLFGRGFYAVLKKYDLLISELAANRQRQGLKARSPKYDALVNNLREFIKNEITRVLNRVVHLYQPAELIIEKLDFRNPALSSRMNRLISWFGKSALTRKLESLQEHYGIKRTATNPAYTSQECSVCGYIEKGNRVGQAVFQCKCCNTGIHADVNAARNHRSRSADKVIDVYKSTEAVLRILTGRFLSHAERVPRLYRKAQGSLSGNPYFRGPLAQSKGFL